MGEVVLSNPRAASLPDKQAGVLGEPPTDGALARAHEAYEEYRSVHILDGGLVLIRVGNTGVVHRLELEEEDLLDLLNISEGQRGIVQ